MAENFFGLTDTGKTRDNNEDTFIAQPVMDNRFILACVIDGVGGYQGGEVAAEIAREEIIREFERSSGDLIPQMIDAFTQASHKISAKKEQDKEHDKMACVATLVIADVQNNQFYYAHVGDTRLYLLRDGSLIKISKDHSFVGFLEDSGRLTETAAMNHPKRNEINKALGFSEQIDTDDSYIETGQSPFLPGDMLLLCSDGLTDMVDKNDITAIITKNSTLEQKATALIDTANNNGGRDNITVVLVQNDKAPQRISATMPVATEKKNDTTEKDIIRVKEEPKVKPAAPVEPVKKGGSGLTILLAVFCLLLLGTTVWLYMQWQKGNVVATQSTTITRAPRNAQEVLLQDAFDNATGDTLILSDTIFKAPIMISDTLHIKQDTLYVKAKGSIILQRDTNYKGPALAVSSTSKVTLLDSLQFKDFGTAIYVSNTALLLKNVQFINCSIPVQNRYTFDNKQTVTARLPVMVMPAEPPQKNTGAGNGAR